MAITPYIIGIPTPPTSPISQEPDVHTIPSPEPKRRRLSPIDDTIVYDEPFHVHVRGNMEWYASLIRSWVRQEQVFAALVAKMDTEIGNMRDAVGEITRLLQRGNQSGQRIERLTADLGKTNKLEAQLAVANAAGYAQDDEPEGEPVEDEDVRSVISSSSSGI
ncbi:hypothetical protein L1987_27491 [Smallanthus sonchifolius]|uniref:Uncharacterized protein n=1 Tax=Smallanthus sonchifolius TaxID=185202 RepID=A0ACB9ICN0_9ASTR|nr:hypothetical protein L1987_27491 [Smallanthus sonchifolius]